MSDSSPRLDLPYIQSAQAQKHVTHNEALRVLDVLVQLTVEAFGTTTPPSLPLEGKVYALGAGANGAWSGQDGALAVWVDGVWQFHAPQVGWQATLAASAEIRVWTGAEWQPVSGAVDFDNLDGVGVNTSSDATNRLAVSAPATLLTHEGAGHQLKINKAATGDTAALLFQTNWSGRAEIGLAGEDAFSIKLSADGTAWDEVLRVAPGMQVFHSGNVVGTVAASPAIGDALIETGSNANGGFTKFADGTMMCWTSGFATAGGAAASWTFPAAFASGAVAVTATAEGLAFASITVDGVTSSGADLRSFDAAGSEAVSPSVSLVALGRWF
jgi:hypothetical protein